MPTRTSCIAAMLKARTLPDLAAMYHEGMEVQVNAAQDGGERVEVDYKDKKLISYTDGLNTWKSFRIPFKAKSDPEYDLDTRMSWDLGTHCEAIGMTGWDWQSKTSKWVAFDFDAILGHSDRHVKKLTPEEMALVQAQAELLEWVTIRRSTAGRGLHLYVLLPPGIETSNHNEHAALARAILGRMSAETGFAFDSKVDICGGNMWVWHRKMAGTEGLTILKAGRQMRLDEVPPNWRDHIKVVKGLKAKTLPQNIGTPETEDLISRLTGESTRIPLDTGHRALIEYLKSSNIVWWWDQDNHMLVTHTHALKLAHEALSLRGLYNTSSDATNLSEQNCFAFPMRNGGWIVRRFGAGCSEAITWSQDRAGWTRCFLNVEPELSVALANAGGIESKKGAYVFREAEMAKKALLDFKIDLTFDPTMAMRETKVLETQDGKILVSISRSQSDEPSKMLGWLGEKDRWERIYRPPGQSKLQDVTETSFDDLIRHTVTQDGTDAGWYINPGADAWNSEPLVHVKAVLSSIGNSAKETTSAIGTSILKPWYMVNRPFKPEYPGGREWNRDSAQLRHVAKDTDNLSYPTWTKLLAHLGSTLTPYIENHAWCKASGIKSGGDYLKLWITSAIKEPYAPLPYLFFYSKENNTGKSTFHEALQLLLTKGLTSGSNALLTDFNGELAPAIFVYIEEVDLRQNKSAANKIKEWVTASQLTVHPKGETTYTIPNTTHWVQCSNNSSYCPILPGDSRITVIHVRPISDPVPKLVLMQRLKAEAADFTTDILGTDLPTPNERLNLPAIATSEKRVLEDMNKNLVELFLQDRCRRCPGAAVRLSEMYELFTTVTNSDAAHAWPKSKFIQEVGLELLVRRSTLDANQLCVGNIIINGQTPTFVVTAELEDSGDGRGFFKSCPRADEAVSVSILSNSRPFDM